MPITNLTFYIFIVNGGLYYFFSYWATKKSGPALEGRGWERMERRGGRADDLAAALLVARRTSGGNSGDGEGRVRRRVAEAGDGEPPVSPSRTPLLESAEAFRRKGKLMRQQCYCIHNFT